MELDKVRYGHAGVYPLAITLLAEYESLSKDSSTFNTTILSNLEYNFGIVAKLASLCENHLTHDFIELFTAGPRRYEREGINHLYLDQVRLGALGRGIVERMDFAVRKLFYRQDVNEWNSDAVTYRGRGYSALSNFADSARKLWCQMTHEFGQEFDAAVKTAVAVSREEQKSNPSKPEKAKYNRNSKAQNKSVQTKPLPPTKPVPTTKPVQTKPVLETVSGDSEKPQGNDNSSSNSQEKRLPANVWKQRMEEAAKVAAEAAKADTEVVKVATDVAAPAIASTTTVESAKKYKQKRKPRDQDDNGGWTKVPDRRKKFVDLEVDLGGKKLKVKAKVMPDGKYKQVTDNA